MEALRNRIAQFQKQFGSEISFKSFGRSEMAILEVQTNRLREAAAWLRSDEEMRFDWLELLSVYERKNRLHVSYFLRSQSRVETCVLRVLPELKAPGEWVTLPSLTSLWPMVQPYEEETGRLFGIHYQATPEEPTPRSDLFPLRKTFQWEKRSR